MSEAWLTRQFRFDLPVERIAVLVSRLRGTLARVAAVADLLGEATLTRRSNGGWSIQEHIGHLFDLDALHLTRLDELAAGAATLAAADMSNQATWRADYNMRRYEDVCAAFGRRRHELLGRLRALDADGLRRKALHPRLQTPMRAIDVAYFAAEHDDHHLAAIEALAAEPGEPAAATSTGWLDLPADTPMALLERRRVIGRQAMISHITLHAGCKVPSHAHANEQFACVLSGRVRFTLADHERILGAGEVLHLPSYAPHAAEAIETAVVLDVFAPPSETTGIDRRDGG